MPENAFENLSNQMAQMRDRKQKLEGELRRLAATAAETGPSAFLVEAINEREKELRKICDQLPAGGASVDTHLLDIRNFITDKMGDLCALLAGDTAPARKELLKHVSEIRMMPQQVGTASGTMLRRASENCLEMSRMCYQRWSRSTGKFFGCGGRI